MPIHSFQHGVALPPTPPLSPVKHNKLSEVGLRTLYPNGQPLCLQALSSTEIFQVSHHLSPLRPLRSSIDSSQLPATLLNTTLLPQAQTINLFHKVGAAAALPQASHLCHSHRYLNAQVVSDILDAVEGEIEDFLPEILARIGNDSPSALPDLEELQKRGGLIGEEVDKRLVTRGYHRLSDVALRYVHAAEDVMSLTLGITEFTYLYNRQPGSSTFPTASCDDNQSKTNKRCAACTLRTIATSAVALIGLRAILLARLPSEVLEAKKRSPRLEVIEGFMRVFGSEQASWMMGVSGRVGWEMRALVAEAQAGSGSRQGDRRYKPNRPERPAQGLFYGGQSNAPPVRYETKPRMRDSPPPSQPPPVRYWTKPVAMIRGSCIPSPLRIGNRPDPSIGCSMVVA